jgi:septal ring factor EnvC (AmiA/AmiB activator)
MRELLAEVHRLKEAIASCPFSSRPETVPLQGHENLDWEISQSAILRSNLEAEITSLKDQAAQLEEQLKAINEQRTQKELELSTLEKDDAVMQTRALQSCQATTQRLKIDNIVAGMTALFDFVKSVLPKPWFYICTPRLYVNNKFTWDHL